MRPFAQRLHPRITQTVASLQIVLPQQKLPLGQTLTFSVVAKNAMCQPIVGAYDHPIVLGAGFLGLSSTSIAHSAQADAVTATPTRTLDVSAG